MTKNPLNQGVDHVDKVRGSHFQKAANTMWKRLLTGKTLKRKRVVSLLK